MSLRLEALGGLRVLVDGVDEPELTGSPLRCGLLVYLSVVRSAPRERVLSLFWPERAPERARHNLSQMLYELRKRFGDESIGLEGDHVSVGAHVTSDVVDFEQAVAVGSPDADRYYRGPFLQAVHLVDTSGYEEWVETTRARLRGVFRDVQRDRVLALRDANRPDEALSAARRWVNAEPLDEEAQHSLLTLLARRGLRNEALRQYERFRRHLQDLGAEPLESLRDLVGDIRAGRLTPAPGDAMLPRTAPQLGAATGLVVLPFEDLSQDGDHGYFCRGLAEEIISRLSEEPALRVIARTSAFSFQGRRILEIASELGVTHAVEGSAQFSSEEFRVRVALVDARTEEEVWQDRIRGSLATDLFTVQDRIAESVARALPRRIDGRPMAASDASARLPTRRRTASPEAYEHWLKGSQGWALRTPESLRDAQRHFEAALELDPEYARALAGLADVYCLLGGFDYGLMPPDEAFSRARAAAEDALRIEPGLARAEAILGNVLVSHDWDWRAGETRYRKAMEIDPNDPMTRQWFSMLSLYLGREDEALAEAEVALENNPRSAFALSHRGRLYQLLGEAEIAAGHFREALEMDPDFATAHLGLAVVALTTGHVEEALERLEPLHEKVDDELTLVHGLWVCALGRGGRREEARAGLLEMKAGRASYLPPEHVAVGYLGLGEDERAVAWLRRAFDARSQAATVLDREPLLDPLRRRPDFRALLTEIHEARTI